MGHKSIPVGWEAQGAEGSWLPEHHSPGSKTTPRISLAAWEWGDDPEMQLLPSSGFSLLAGNTRIRGFDIKTAVRESPAANLMCSHRTSSVTNPETTWSLVGPPDLLLSFLLPLY